MTTTLAPATFPVGGDRLMQILTEEDRLYRRLVAVAEAQRDALLLSDSDALVPLVREAEGIAEQVTALEAERRAEVARITGDERITISALLGRVDAGARDQLEVLRTGLQQSFARLRAVNDLNAGLVRQALALTDGMARLARTATPSTYAPTGALTDARLAGREWAV